MFLFDSNIYLENILCLPLFQYAPFQNNTGILVQQIINEQEKVKKL